MSHVRGKIIGRAVARHPDRPACPESAQEQREGLPAERHPRACGKTPRWPSPPRQRTFCTDTKAGTFAGTQPGTLAGAFTGTPRRTHFCTQFRTHQCTHFRTLFPMLDAPAKKRPISDRPSHPRRVPCVGSDRLDLLRFASAKRSPDRPSWGGRTAGACPLRLCPYMLTACSVSPKPKPPPSVVCSRRRGSCPP